MERFRGSCSISKSKENTFGATARCIRKFCRSRSKTILCRSSYGQGKTRLQMEWCYQALNDPDIIEQFLSEAPLPDIWGNRKAFLNTLYQTIFMQRMVVSSGNELKQQGTIIKMIKDNVFDRFKDETVTLKNGWSLNITSESLKDDRLASVGRCVDLFNACVDQFCVPPTEYPFDVPNVDRNLLIFGIDECQCYSEKYEGTQKEDLVHKLLAVASGARSELINTSAFWMVTGTIVPGSFPSTPTYFQLVKSSMENLLNVKYLDTIAKQYFGKALHRGSSEDVLANDTAQTLVRLFYRTFGVPRAIEVMLEAAHEFLVKMENFYATKLSATASSGHFSSHRQIHGQLKAVSAKLDEKLSYLFPNSTPEALFRHGILKCQEKESQHALELLDIKAALCLHMHIKNKIPGLNVEPQLLEEAGYLIQWNKIDENIKQYTRPFLYSYEAAFAPLPLLQTTATSLHWTPLDISLATLILHPNCSSNVDGNKKGRCFEMALAASLYARYKVESQGQTEIELQNIFACKDLPDELHTAKGVVMLKKQVSCAFADLLCEIEEKQVIAIDGESSEFADIVLPAKIDGNTVFIGFHTQQNKGKCFKLNKNKVAKNALTVLKAPNFYFIAVASVMPISTKVVHATMISLAKKMAKKSALKQELPDLFNKLLGLQTTETIENKLETVNTINKMKEIINPTISESDAENKAREMTKRVSVLNASVIVSPIYQSYFGFASVFKDTELGDKVAKF